MNRGPRNLLRPYGKLLPDLLLLFLSAAVLIRPLFRAKYLDRWASIESTFIADGRFLAAHWPHPLWQPLWYCGTRFDYIYPPVLRYGTALLSTFFIPVKAYHVFTALLFCAGIAGVYFLVRTMGAGRLQGWISAISCALVSPSFLFLKDMRNDASYLMPARLGVLIRYGEGPHISSLSLLPFALAFAFLAIRRWRPGALALAALFCALVTLTNFYGATALAMFYPILVWSIWVVYRERAVLLRALAIPALAYSLTAFWLTPSYFRITLYNLRYVSQPGNRYSVLLTIVAALIFSVISFRRAHRKPELLYVVFAAGSLLFFSLNVLGHYYFNFRILGEPHRLVPELDMAMILAGVELLRRLWIRPFSTQNARRTARGFVLAVAFFTVWTTRHFIVHAWDTYPNEPDYQQRVEYRMSDWIATNMPGARTYVAGSVRFWWDAWHDNAEVGGGSDQGLINPNPTAASWEIILGSDPELSVRWLQSLGADAVIVSDANSREIYHDFRLPYKFAGTLPVLFDDREGNVIYGVPRRYRSIARVVDTATSKTVRPVQPATDLALLRAYSDMVEEGPDSPALTEWKSTDSLSIHASLKEGESLLAQVTYDPAWHAYSDGRELPIRPDAMDFMAIDAPPGVSNIVLVFEMPLENRIGYAASGIGLLICFGLCVMTGKTETVEVFEPEPATLVRTESYPLYLRLLGRFLRWLHHHLPPWRGDLEPEPFDQQKLDRAARALRGMSMPDAGGDAYLEKHIPRLSRTLALVPPPQTTGRVLELGCYMQITPLLQRVCGYREVRGAYYGSPGKIDRKTYDFPDGQFECYVDHFDVERDPFPYPDGYFDLVVAGEIIEHMTYDPMWMLLEARRVLADGGYLLLSTPNVGSVASVAKTLYGRDNPQIFFVYERPEPGKPPEIGHVREYTTYELGEAAKAAGFEVEALFTTFIEEYASHRVLLNFLALNGYETKNRGEQSWCLARKRASLPTDRFPFFIYTP